MVGFYTQVRQEMLRTVIIFALFGLAAAGPAVVRSREEIEAFRQFLDNTRTGKGNGERFQGRKMSLPDANAEELSGRFQGDIILDDEDYETLLQEYSVGRNAYRASSITVWPNDTVVWEFGNGEFDELQKAAIREGIRDIEAHSCVKFRYREPSDSVYVKLTGDSSGCNAHIGYRKSRGAHQMNLARNTVGSGCFRHATIVHEWMHILGFLHMHATYNRDQYVEINEKNIKPGSEHNFIIYGPSNVNNYDIDYDYVSCMHYGPTAFSGNGEPTIVPLLKSNGEMGQRSYVSDKDWLRINRHYDCPGAWD